MNRVLYRIAAVLLITVFLVSVWMMVRQKNFYDDASVAYKRAESVSEIHITENEAAENEVRTPVVWKADPYVNALQDTDLTALREINKDIVGWIMIPDTVINYPVLQGEDNQYYLEHTWENNENPAGSIFMESTNQPDFSDIHTLIYGHNMKDKSMFASIRNYSGQEYWKNHPDIYVVTDTGVWQYEIYASYEADVTGLTYMLNFGTEEEMQSFLDLGMEKSVIDTGIVPKQTDKILTLSTCTGGGYQTRWVVQARLETNTSTGQEDGALSVRDSIPNDSSTGTSGY